MTVVQGKIQSSKLKGESYKRSQSREVIVQRRGKVCRYNADVLSKVGFRPLSKIDFKEVNKVNV
ncbi:MAG: hypothetical protein QY331_07475 [Melioribacteraceae bacterium]|nr:hypothetical protein [Melioribacteraceae bacterium]WKZ71091.1 MAG: hypothetical protein QY331_07475 [Melioribacteraceae bacterium]